jgi:hypothetical protein
MFPSNEPTPILRVTVGVPVYTADDQKLGKVKDIRGSAFQIETGLFQRDFWLSEDTVAEAVPEHSVVLAIDKGELDIHKLSNDELAA